MPRRCAASASARATILPPPNGRVGGKIGRFRYIASVRIIDLGTLNYRDAWQRQEAIHAEVLAGAEEAILLVEHPPTITFGRRAADSASHLVASPDFLERSNVELVESDRGGDITFHGPGQLVAYPIVRLADHRLSVGAYVKTLEHSVIAALKPFGIDAFLDVCAIGIWTGKPSAKICALGVRIKRGVSLHGIALNVITNLDYFNLINPCGLGRPVTSMQKILGDRCPPMSDVKRVVAEQIAEGLNQPPLPVLRGRAGEGAAERMLIPHFEDPLPNPPPEYRERE